MNIDDQTRWEQYVEALSLLEARIVGPAENTIAEWALFCVGLIEAGNPFVWEQGVLKLFVRFLAEKHSDRYLGSKAELKAQLYDILSAALPLDAEKRLMPDSLDQIDWARLKSSISSICRSP
jgi:hypothetical protein